MPVDPISAIQGVAGIVQSIGGAIQTHKAQKQLNNLISSYKPNASILDYYNKALSRYSANPFQSSLYNNAIQSANRGLATGINTLNDRRSVLGGIGSLVQGYNDASLRAAAAAEGQQGQALSQLGQATGMKAQEEFKPFEMRYNMLASKAGGGNQILNSGLSNIFGAGQSISQMATLKKMYGDDYGNGGTTIATGNGIGINTTDAIRRYARR